MDNFFKDLKEFKNDKLKVSKNSKNYTQKMSMSKDTFTRINIDIVEIFKRQYPYLEGLKLTHGHILKLMSDLIISHDDKNTKDGKKKK